MIALIKLEIADRMSVMADECSRRIQLSQQWRLLGCRAALEYVQQAEGDVRSVLCERRASYLVITGCLVIT